MGSIYSGRAAQPTNFSGAATVLLGLTVVVLLAYLIATYGDSEFGGMVTDWLRRF